MAKKFQVMESRIALGNGEYLYGEGFPGQTEPTYVNKQDLLDKGADAEWIEWLIENEKLRVVDATKNEPDFDKAPAPKVDADNKAPAKTDKDK